MDVDLQVSPAELEGQTSCAEEGSRTPRQPRLQSVLQNSQKLSDKSSPKSACNPWALLHDITKIEEQYLHPSANFLQNENVRNVRTTKSMS